MRLESVGRPPWSPHARRGTYELSEQAEEEALQEGRSERQAQGTQESARRWFLTLAKKPGVFDCCGARFDRGAEVVYRHKPREVRCVRCAGRLEESKGYRPSVRWDRAHRHKGTGT
jgi:hypothetical protein